MLKMKSQGKKTGISAGLAGGLVVWLVLGSAAGIMIASSCQKTGEETEEVTPESPSPPMVAHNNTAAAPAPGTTAAPAANPGTTATPPPATVAPAGATVTPAPGSTAPAAAPTTPQTPAATPSTPETPAAAEKPKEEKDREAVEKMVRDYYDAINNHDLAKAKQYWIKEGADGGKVQKAITDYEKVTLVTVGTPAIVKNKAKVEASVSAARKGGGTPDDICKLFSLTKVKEVWKIESTAGKCKGK